MNQELVATAKKRLEDMLSFFEVNAKVEATSGEDTIELAVDAEAGGRLIGHRGEMLAAIQHMLNMMIRNETTDRVYVHVDIGGYRQARLEKLEEQARTAAQKVLDDNEEVILPMMNAAERRHIHGVLTGVNGIATESRGEGNRRRLVIRPD